MSGLPSRRFIPIAWVLVCGAAVATLAAAIPRMRQAEAVAHARLILFARVTTDAQELSRLRAGIQAADRDGSSESVPPKLATAVGGVLAASGLPAAALSSLSPESEAVEIAGADARVLHRRATLVLSPLTLPQLGRFVQNWRERHPGWTVSRLDLEPRHDLAASPGADIPLRVVLGFESLTVDAMMNE